MLASGTFATLESNLVRRSVVVTEQIEWNSLCDGQLLSCYVLMFFNCGNVL